MTSTQTSIKQARRDLWILVVMTVGAIGFSIFFGSFLFSAESFSENNKNTYYVFLLAAVSLTITALYGIRYFLFSLFEAHDVSVRDKVIELSYLHLGKRQYEFSPQDFSKSKVNVRRFRRSSNGFESMWLIRFGKWRFATVPIDWIDPTRSREIYPQS